MPPPLSDDAQGSKPKPNLNMSLHDLPAPSFKAGPLGGRSVPALEKSNLFASSESDSTALVAGTLTPGARGPMGMGRDPWNVFGSEEPKATASGSAWQDTPKDAKLDALARPTSTLARSSSYNGDSGHLKDPRSKPPLQRADTQQKPQERQPQPSPSETNGSGDDVLAANLAHLSLQPSQPPPQAQWVDKATAYPDPNAFYGAAAFANDVHSQQPQYDVFRRDAAYTVDYTQQPGGARRVPSAGWQLPVLGGGDQRINNRSPSNSRPPYAPPSNPMSRTASASSLYGLASTQLANPNALMYQHQQPAINSQFYNPAMFSPAAPQSRNLPTPHNYARSAYDAPSPIVDYAAYGANFQPPSVASSTHSSYHDYGGGMPGAMRYEDRVRSVRSPLLEEFRANRHRRWDLSDIRGHVVEFSGDQLGSRHLQSKLDSATVEDKRLFFEEMMPNVLALSTDLFSNYVVQKAFEIADHNQKLSLVKALEGNVLQLSLQMYGCRVVQKALECVLVDEQTVLCNELKGNVLKCARDQNANHVLQRVLERVPADRIKFIPEACEGQVYSLATHPYGCRVLQRILENISDVRPLIDELLKHTQTLMQDQYANYVIQHLLERGTQADRSVIVSHVRGQVVHFSKHKFASNVIDKVILCADENERRALTDEILYDPSAISNMLKDQFANYCLQKFMLVVTGPQREPLISQVADALLTIRKYSGTYSKHLLAIEKYIQNEQAMNQYNAQMAAAGVDPSMIPLR